MKFYLYLDDKGIVKQKIESTIDQEGCIEVDEETYHKALIDRSAYIDGQLIEDISGYQWIDNKWVFDLESYKEAKIQEVETFLMNQLYRTYPLKKQLEDSQILLQSMITIKTLFDKSLDDTVSIGTDIINEALSTQIPINDVVESYEELTEIEKPYFKEFCNALYKANFVASYKAYIKQIQSKIKNCNTKDCVDQILSSMEIPQIEL